MELLLQTFSVHLRAANWVFSLSVAIEDLDTALVVSTIFDRIFAQTADLQLLPLVGSPLPRYGLNQSCFPTLVGVSFHKAFSALLLCIVYLMRVAFVIRRK